MSVKIITLPKKEDMLTRLLSVDSNEHISENLYPILLKSAGRRLDVQGVNMMISSAIIKYREEHSWYLANSQVLKVRKAQFVEALTDDSEFADAAKALLS